MKVLICDDDPPTRMIIRKLVERYFRYEVTECGNGAQAIELLGKDTYGLVFLDLTMPVQDGIETLEKIRQSPATQNLPVVILSSEKDQEAIIKVMQLGIADYVLKPPRTTTVIQKVEKILQGLPPQ